MKSTDPVLEVLKKLTPTAPDKLKQLIDAYEKDGIDALDDAWDKVIKETIDAYQ